MVLSEWLPVWRSDYVRERQRKMSGEKDRDRERERNAFLRDVDSPAGPDHAWGWGAHGAPPRWRRAQVVREPQIPSSGFSTIC